MNPAEYFREYRKNLGFSNQADAKAFLAGKDVSPSIDLAYIEALNIRIAQILRTLNPVIHRPLQHSAIEDFIQQSITTPYAIIKGAGLLSKLNNQGRRPEEVLFSWLRGYALCEFFTPAFAQIFNVSLSSITNIGTDDLQQIDTFRKSPKADLSIQVHDKIVRIEVQSGFQGVNDIKAHKVTEARRAKETLDIATVCIHLDIYNGQVAFVQLDTIEENDINFITRQQMEGQSVFQIEQNFFKWRLIDPTPCLSTLELCF